MSEDKKAEFNFGFLIILGVLFMIVDVSISYLIHKGSGSSNATVLKFINIILNLKKQELFSNHFFTKLISLIFLIIGISLNSKLKKPKENNNKNSLQINIIYSVFFTILYLTTHLIFSDENVLYLVLTILFFFTIANFYFKVFSNFKHNMGKDRFTKEARKFEQTKKIIENEYSVNIKTGDGYINVINPFRAVAVMGTPGSGKTFAVLLAAIQQMIKKGFAMFIYDYKFPDLTTFAYNCYLEYYNNYEVKPKFNIINFDDIEYTHRCNPLDPKLLLDFVDAVESAKTIMMGLNKTWIEKEGDFFIESPINFLAICIWALKLDSEKSHINYCSLPHVIELVSTDYPNLFKYLMKFDYDASIANVLAPFSSALENESYEQLDGQIASVRLGLSRLTSPIIYYVMTTGKESGENISLQINDPESPQILCIGNNPERQQIYGAVISLYNSRLIALVNKKGKLKTGLFWDELPTISMPKGTLDNLIATARSNKIATWLGFQDLQQLIRDYGEKNAKAIFGTIGNVITGMISGDTAKALSEKFGKVKVKKENYSLSSGKVSTSFSEEMQETIPASDLSTLPQGWFAGQVADNFGEEIEQKYFYSNIIVDIEERKKFEKHKLPKVFDFEASGLDKAKVLKENFDKIRHEIKNLLNNA